jgi:opacity protein-like surface antigen
MTNKITTICCAVALLATTAATPALSQAKNFAGPSIAIGGGYSSQTYGLKLTDTDTPYDATFDAGKNDFSALVELSYGIELDKSFALSLGATYDLTDSKVNSFVDSEGVSVKSKLKDHYSLYLQPTFLVNNNTGIFGKLSYNFAKSAGTISDGTDSLSNSKNLEGWGYGIGAKTFLNNSTYIQIEGNYVEYDKHNVALNDVYSISAKPKILSALVSVGYKF